MTSLEKALTNALDRAWMEHERGDPAVAFDYLYRAVKLLAGLAIHREARSLPAGLPQDEPEASAGSNVPSDWESVAKSHVVVIRAALHWLQNEPGCSLGKCRDEACKILEGALEHYKPGLGRTLYPLAPNAVIKGP